MADSEKKSREGFFRQSIDDIFEKSQLRNIIKHIKDDDFLDRLDTNDKIPILINQIDNPPHIGCALDERIRPELGRLYRAFSINLLFENIFRLTNEYNTRHLPSLEKHFPLLYKKLVDTKSVFVRKALVPCEMRSCDEEDILQEMEGFSQDEQDEHRRKYGILRSKMRKNRVTFQPVTPKLVGLIEKDSRYPPLSNPFLELLGTAYRTYTSKDSDIYRLINQTLRSSYTPQDQFILDFVYRKHESMSLHLSKFLPALVFPFTTNKDLIVYRSDDMRISTDEFVVKGVLSSSLSLRVPSLSVKRLLKITIPAGQQFLPMIVIRNDMAEIGLLPGTRLKKTRETACSDGHCVEYDVTSGPSEFSGLQIATILRAAICYKEGNVGDLPNNEEQDTFIYNLIDSKYDGESGQLDKVLNWYKKQYPK